MAGDWIKFEKATLDKPEIFELAGILGIDPDAVIGKLLRVWDWFDDQSVDGYAPVALSAQLNRNTGVTGFVEAMQQVGWIEIENNRLKVPNFNRHNGQSAKNRALSAKRMAKSRGKSCDDTVTSSVTETQPEKRREEKSNKRMAKPSVDEVLTYGMTLDPPFKNVGSFLAFYESNGWKVGKNPMKDWKAAVRTWQQKEKQSKPPQHRPIFESPTHANGTIKHRGLWD